MHKYIFFLFSLLLSWHTFPAHAKEIQGELWSGSIYTATFKAGVCVNANDAVHGVLLLRQRNGQVDSYHFSGNKNLNNIFNVRHNDGHTFSGKITSEHSVEGIVKLHQGISIPLKGKREQNVVLGENCRPLHP